MADVTKKEICKCTNCGNEAEMMVTCSLEDGLFAEDSMDDGADGDIATIGKKVKGTATCSHCGNEADMWINI